MGREATLARRKVVEVAQASVDRTNDAIKLVEEVRGQHNAFTEKFGADIEAVQQRLKMQGAWIGDVETVTKGLPTLSDVETRVADLRRQHRTELQLLSGRLARFETMTRWQRFLWFALGRLP